MGVRYGFQTYTWQMSLDRYAGEIRHICSVVRESGLDALEAEICMLRGVFDDAGSMASILREEGVGFFALCLVCDWLGDGESPEERTLADRAIGFVKGFAEPTLLLCQMPQGDRAELRVRQSNALKCVGAVAERAAASGVRCAFHPNSPIGSVFRTHEDYLTLLDGLDGRRVGFAPDSGHIVKGGMDVYRIFKDHARIITHAHYKDIGPGGDWRLMGEGSTDFPRLSG
ncbi:MAG: TIM barrel protein, partial [Oscillospiraceae bacterium]|nr:TIM barrel protein [Oscillospiraceae bacterium]